MRGLWGTYRGLGGDGHLGAEGDGASDGDDVGLVGDELEPTVGVGEGLAEASVEDHLVQRGEAHGDDDVSKAEALSDEELVVQQEVVEDLEGLADVSLGGLGGIRVLGDDAEDGVQPGGGGEVDLVDGEINPLINEASLVDAATVEVVGVTVEAGGVTGDGIALEDGALGGLQGGDLAKRVLLQELGGLVLTGLEINLMDLDLDSVDASGDLSLEDSGVGGVGVDGVSCHSNCYVEVWWSAPTCPKKK